MFTIAVLLLNVSIIAATTSNEEKSLAEVTLRNANESDPNVLHLDVEAFGNLYHFDLVPAPKIFHPQLKEYFADLDENGTSSIIRAVDKQSNHVEMMEKLYTDKTGHAAVHVEEINGHVYVEGTLSNNMRISPSRIDSTLEAPIHIAYRQLESENLTSGSCITISPNITFPVDSTLEERAMIPSMIFPELLILLDYPLSQRFQFNIHEARKYLATFFNSVNTRYTQFTNPKIRMVIHSILLTTNPLGNPFIQKLNTGVDASITLDRFGKWAYKYRFALKGNYDIALYLTESALNSKDRLEKSLGGIAIISGVCLSNGDKQLKVALVKDAGSRFQGVRSAAHELAHSLGAAHDGDSNPASPKNPGAKSCPWDDGYIMSYVNNPDRNEVFSHCSISQVEFTIKSSEAACLLNNPATDLMEEDNETEPGEIITLDDQCKGYYGPHSHFDVSYFDQVCSSLWCTVSGKVLSRAPASDGSSCKQDNDKWWCINGRCVEKKHTA